MEASQASQNWDIVFRLLTGSSVSVPFDAVSMSTVGHCRAWISRHLNKSPSQIRLIHSGRVLGDDSRTLESAGIREGTNSIHVVLRPAAPLSQTAEEATQQQQPQQQQPPRQGEPQQPVPLDPFELLRNMTQGGNVEQRTNGPDRVVLDNSFPSRLETVVSRSRVLDQRLRASSDRPPSRLTDLNNFDAVNRPVQSTVGALYDYSQLLEAFQLPLQMQSNTMQEERFLTATSALERIGRYSRQEDLRTNLLALAEVTTNLAAALECIHYQDNNAPPPQAGMGGRIQMPPMPMPIPAMMPMMGGGLLGHNTQGGAGLGSIPPSAGIGAGPMGQANPFSGQATPTGDQNNPGAAQHLSQTQAMLMRNAHQAQMAELQRRAMNMSGSAGPPHGPQAPPPPEGRQE